MPTLAACLGMNTAGSEAWGLRLCRAAWLIGVSVPGVSRDRSQRTSSGVSACAGNVWPAVLVRSVTPAGSPDSALAPAPLAPASASAQVPPAPAWVWDRS
jgi:hypothetical protein